MHTFSALKKVMRLFPVWFFFHAVFFLRAEKIKIVYLINRSKMGQYGVLSAHLDHWLQVKWEGTFIPHNADTDEVITLDKTDVESVGNRDQIRIKDS